MYQFYVKIRNLNTVKINSWVWLCKWNSNMRNNKFIIKKISEFGNNIGQLPQLQVPAGEYRRVRHLRG